MDYCVHVSALSVSHVTRLQDKVSGGRTGRGRRDKALTGDFHTVSGQETKMLFNVGFQCH